MDIEAVAVGILINIVFCIASLAYCKLDGWIHNDK